MKLTQLSLNGNPGSADFKPTAKAGPAGGIDVPQGATTGITLGVEVPENGNDDPWGTNVTYAWSRTEGTGGTLTDATAAQAVFTPPATDGTHAFRLTVTGGGGVAGTSTVSVHVGAAGVPPMPVSAVVNGPTLTLTYSKNLQAEPPPASDSGKGQVYLAVVSVPGVRRNIEPVPPSAVEVMGRQVILTFKPSIRPQPGRDALLLPGQRHGGEPDPRSGRQPGRRLRRLRVRNVLSEGPVVRDIAFAGAAKTYGIGDTVGIDVTFSDPVAVTVTGGAPTLALEIGSANRKARWKAGQAAGAVQRFEYTVAEGEEDTDGIAVKADGLAVPSRSSILTTAEREAVILGHGRVHDPAHKVDGVRPTVPPSQTVPGDARATAASISSSPSSGSTYRAGETVTVRLAMNEAVLVTGRPYILLDVGGVRRRAVYSGPIGSSTDVLDFSYTVQAGDLDTDGVGLCVAGRRPGCGSIDLNGGSIRAAGDESAASLGHPALAAQSGHKVDAAPLPALSTACADEIRVRIDWALKPSSVSAGGTFRLLFVGSVDRNAQSSNIADYNRFVQSLAAAGHSSIRPFKGGFRAVGSTAAVDARDNTCTTGTGVPIHWLNGNQVADNYADFYDNSWDDQANPKTESGNAIGPSQCLDGQQFRRDKRRPAFGQYTGRWKVDPFWHYWPNRGRGQSAFRKFSANVIIWFRPSFLRPLPGLQGAGGERQGPHDRYRDHLQPGDRGRLPSRRDRRSRGDVFRGGDRARRAAGRAVGQERDRERRQRVRRRLCARVRDDEAGLLLHGAVRPEGRRRHPALFQSAAAERRHDHGGLGR